MGSAEMQCIVCEAAPRAGVLFLHVLEGLFGDPLQDSVPVISEHHPPCPPSIHSNGKRHHRKHLSAFFEVCLDDCSAPIL